MSVTSAATLTVFGRAEVTAALDYDRCIKVVRAAMQLLSEGRTQQMLRQITPISGGDVLSAMAGVMPPEIGFGAKVISVYPENGKMGRQSHQGVVVLFEAETGAPIAVLHAGDVTRIRTAAASAVATDALARPEASRLAVLGYGEQGQAHVEAISRVRALSSVALWGRSPGEAARIAAQLSRRLGLPVEPAASVEAAVDQADIICTTTASADPILRGQWIAAGAHLNLVGSSEGASAEVDDDLVARSRFFADHREGVLQQGGEYLRAHESGRVGPEHVLGEIGDVLNGSLAGRIRAEDVTVYKSLGHIVQDVASARAVCDLLARTGHGSVVAF